MTRLTLEQLLIANLRQEFHKGVMSYSTKEEAYLALKKWTGQDFGYDADKWEEWVNKNGLPVLDNWPKEKKYPFS